MNRLPIEKRAQILSLLVEGMSMRAITRVADVSINTVTKLLADVGMACNFYQAQALVNLPCKRIQCDEIWSFCGSKAKNVAPEHQGILGYGDVWTWTAIDADTKLCVTYQIGKRDAEYGQRFMDDLQRRLAGRVQLTSDGYGVYAEVIAAAFRHDIDYAQLVKIYGEPAQKSERRRYSPSAFVTAERRAVTGNPDMRHASTSFVERQNLTMRMGMRRFTRLTNGFSKKVENLEHAVSLHFMYYNFARIHKTLRVTPAMAAGVADHVWTLEEIAELGAD